MHKHIIGIDPDMATCSAVLIQPGGTTNIFLDKVKLPKKKSKYTQQEKLAYASMSVSNIVRSLSDLYIRSDTWEIYIEHQSAAHAKQAKKIKWQDLINLAHISGIWAGAFARGFRGLSISPDNIHIIYASTWKQQQTKWVNQRRTLDAFKMPWKKLGGLDPYPVPTDKSQLAGLFRLSTDQPNDSDFKDITDSMGIALWAFNKQIKEMKRV